MCITQRTFVSIVTHAIDLLLYFITVIYLSDTLKNYKECIYNINTLLL